MISLFWALLICWCLSKIVSDMGSGSSIFYEKSVMNLGKLFNFPEPQFFHLKMWDVDRSTYQVDLIYGVIELIHGKYFHRMVFGT